MNFINNLWYVAAWSHELPGGAPVSRMVIGDTVVLFRDSNGDITALEDRCPHRFAPLSLGRIENDTLRCMYHGLRFNQQGDCVEVPGSTAIPPRLKVRSYPVVERFSWIWIWMGEPSKADVTLIPDAFGLDDPQWVMQSSALDYAADYQLINDNLCDLSHLDFAHETSLGASSGCSWSAQEPKITRLDNGLQIERWWCNTPLGRDSSGPLGDTFNSYRFLLPGLFLMRTRAYPPGTGDESEFQVPKTPPLFEVVEQQAVTPRADGMSRYLYATGLTASVATKEMLDAQFAVINTAFGEDKRIIEAQQKVCDQTSSSTRKTFIPQDKAPTMFRQLVAARISEEAPAGGVGITV